MLGHLPVRKSTAKVSTTVFILGDLEGERGLAEWGLWLQGPCLCPTLRAEQPQASRAWHLAEPGAKIPEPQLRAGARGAGGGSGVPG